MAVCIYSPSANIWGGGQIYIESLCRYLNDAGISTLVATSETGTFGCPCLSMPSVAKKMERLRSAPSLAMTLKRQGYRVIILNDLSALWLAPVFRLFGLKVIALLHLYLQRKNAVGLGHSALEYRLLRVSSRFCHCILSVNKNNTRVLPRRVEFVGNFISPWFFSAPVREVKRYDLGMVARLSLQKNVLLFIRIVAELNSRSRRPIRALILGKGPELERANKEILRRGVEQCIDIKHWAERDQLPGVYDQLKCFAITSYYEGFPTTLLEAHARGVPAISTRSAGFCAEFLEGFGACTGLVFEPEEVLSVQFKNSLLEVIENSSSFRNACVSKARVFSEDRVLGAIRANVERLLPY